MAKVRIGFSTHFEVENELVGIGTDNPTNTLQALGNIKSSNAKAVGVSTLTTFDGFTDTKARIEGSAGAKQHTTSGEIIIEGDVTVSSGTTFTSGPENLTVTDNFTLPGVSDDKPSIGDIRFNENLGAIQVYVGGPKEPNFPTWRSVNSYVDMGNMGRAVLLGGNHNPASAAIADIGAFSVVTRGEETVFGDLALGTNAGNACGSATRAVLFTGRGVTPEGIQYTTIQSLGTSHAFGDTHTAAYRSGGTFSSSTRGVNCGGRGNPGNPHTVIQYVEISTKGNAIEFGALQINGRGQGGGFSSPTRGFSHGNAPYSADIQMVTIASKGNATRWGDNTYGGAYQCGNSNSVRGSIAGGYQFPGAAIQGGKSYVIMASEGNAIDFGGLSDFRVGYAYKASSNTRGFVAGGNSVPLSRTTVDSFLFESKGEVEAWGDLSEGKRDGGSTTDCHGGLGGF